MLKRNECFQALADNIRVGQTSFVRKSFPGRIEKRLLAESWGMETGRPVLAGQRLVTGNACWLVLRFKLRVSNGSPWTVDHGLPGQPGRNVLVEALLLPKSVRNQNDGSLWKQTVQ